MKFNLCSRLFQSPTRWQCSASLGSRHNLLAALFTVWPAFATPALAQASAPIVQMSAGASHTLTLRSDGSVEAWGSNLSGESDVPVLPAGVSFTEVSAGEGFSAALRSDGEVLVWGSNAYGQWSVPALPPGLSYVEVTAGLAHVLARRSDGAVVGWGNNTSGECDIPVPPAGVSYVELAASGSVYDDFQPVFGGTNLYGYSLARRSDGAVVSFGSVGFWSVPAIAVHAPPTGVSYVQISAGPGGWSGVRSDGQIGPTPWPALAPGLSYVEVHGSVARVSDGSVVQLGTAPGTVPALPPGSSYVDLAGGGQFYFSDCGQFDPPCPPHFIDTAHYIARRSDGAVVAWGDNDSGQCALPWNAEAVSYCGGGVNSTGDFAQIRAFGSASLTSNDLVLNTVGMPNTLFLFARGTAQASTPFGDGVLCLGGNLRRMGRVGFAPNGVAEKTVDLPSVGITSLGEQHFQCWFRDNAPGGAGVNTSNAISITFVP